MMSDELVVSLAPEEAKVLARVIDIVNWSVVFGKKEELLLLKVKMKLLLAESAVADRLLNDLSNRGI